jgi:P2-related tail formation protein
LQGFDVAENEEQQRELIKRSIALHKFIGTPWAIREACRTVGFPVVCIEEGVSSAEHSDHENDWARFNVIIETDKRVTAEQSRKLRLFIEFYKNERSHLVELGYFQLLADECNLTGEDALTISFVQSAAYSTAYSKAYSRIKWKAYSTAYSKAYSKNN